MYTISYIIYNHPVVQIRNVSSSGVSCQVCNTRECASVANHCMCDMPSTWSALEPPSLSTKRGLAARPTRDTTSLKLRHTLIYTECGCFLTVLPHSLDFVRNLRAHKVWGMHDNNQFRKVSFQVLTEASIARKTLPYVGG